MVLSSPPHSAPKSAPNSPVEIAANSADQVATAAVAAKAVELPLVHRPRRLRRTEGLRRMVRETVLTVDDLIYPMFVMEGSGQRQEVPSMPGCYRYSLDLLLEEIREVVGLGIGAIALFPLIPDHQKDNAGTESFNPAGLIPQTVRAIKQAFPQLLVITDVALVPPQAVNRKPLFSR